MYPKGRLLMYKKRLLLQHLLQMCTVLWNLECINPGQTLPSNPMLRLHMAYFWVHSLASLLYLKKKKKSVKLTVPRWWGIIRLCRIFYNPYLLHMFFFFHSWDNIPLTSLCLICRYVQYQVLKGHLGLGHITGNIWIVKLKQTKNIYIC